MTGGEVSAAAQSCENCHAPLQGKYCTACGQRHEPHIHSLGEFLNEAAESITHADSRVWRTIWPLLFKPGFLTLEFLEGRRARYLPPFRLYLVLSVLFFLVAAMGRNNDTRIELGTPNDKTPAEVAKPTVVPKTDAETPAQRADRICNEGRFGIPGAAALEPRLREGCRHIVMDNGRGLAQELYHNTPRALFILLPLLALVMRLMYLRRYYVEHLLFFVHSHAFTFALFTVYLLAIKLIDWGWFIGIATTAVIFLVPYYTYRAMLRVYRQGKWVTRVKFTVLSLAYIVCVTLMAVLTSLYTVVML